jgi:CPA2 family monovalent cation:H+ antiporter-2
LIVRLLGLSGRLALVVGVALAQIGEFSFIVASLGRELSILPPEATNTLVAASIISITLNPLLFRLAARFREVSPAPLTKEASPEPAPSASYRAIVVGYGPVGETVSRLLRDNGIEPTVIEMNVETVRKLRESGTRAVYGDALRGEVWKEAGVEGAIAVVLSASVEHGGAEIVRRALELNPALRVVARCSYLAEVEAMRRAGARAAFSGEGEVALSMTEFILRELGATRDHIDRERHRVHSDLLGDA